MEAAERSFHDSAYVPIWSSLFWWRSSAASPGWNQNFFSLTNHFQEHVMLQECLLRSFIICYLPVPPTSLFVFIIQMFWSSSDFQKIPYSLKSHLIILPQRISLKAATLQKSTLSVPGWLTSPLQSLYITQVPVDLWPCIRIFACLLPVEFKHACIYLLKCSLSSF